MLIDTHCHLNMMVKKEFDRAISPAEIQATIPIIQAAHTADVSIIINVGTSRVESYNSILIAQASPHVYATVGIHPNDCTASWRTDFKEIASWVKQKEEHKIVGIGECGLDFHYPDPDIQRQKDAFRAHIELALEHDLALVVHSRDAYDETLTFLDEYKQELTRVTIHCFSYDLPFAEHVLPYGWHLGIDAPITYPKNETLRTVVKNVPLTHLVLETDAPFLPPQELRGKQNHPLHVKTIAEYIAHLRAEPLETVCHQTTQSAKTLFAL